MKNSPENRMKSMRPSPARQSPPAYTKPTTSHSAIGKCSTASPKVWLLGANGKTFAKTAAATNGSKSQR